MDPQSVLNCVTMYERFCDDVTIDARKHRDNVQTMVLLFQKNVDVRDAYKLIFEGDPFLDWQQMDPLKNMRIYKDTASWITLLQYMEVVADEIKDLAERAAEPPAPKPADPSAAAAQNAAAAVEDPKPGDWLLPLGDDPARPKRGFSPLPFIIGLGLGAGFTLGALLLVGGP